ncbi:MAG: hypothetical protein V3U30_04305 [Thermoplasmata archaeon]
MGINVHHVTQYVRPLLSEEMLQERTSHIQRGKRRRKVYFLTVRGRNRAASLRSALLAGEVPFRSRSGKIRVVPFSEVEQEHRRGTPFCELLLELKSLGYAPEEAGEEAPAQDPNHPAEGSADSVPRATGPIGRLPQEESGLGAKPYSIRR